VPKTGRYQNDVIRPAKSGASWQSLVKLTSLQASQLARALRIPEARIMAHPPVGVTNRKRAKIQELIGPCGSEKLT